MRVLKISWEYPPHIEGGLGRHVTELVPALAGQGVELHIVTPTTMQAKAGRSVESVLPQPDSLSADTNIFVAGATVDVENGVYVHRVPAPLNDTSVDVYVRVIKVNFILEAYVKQIYRQYGPWDLIHVHDWLTGFSGLALKRTLNCPLVATIHATERGRFRGYFDNHIQSAIDSTEQELVCQSDRVIVCSHYMHNELQSFFQIPPSKLDVVPNGVDISGLNNNHHTNMREFRSKFAAPYERIVFTVSRLVFEKGVHVLIAAAPRILANCPSAKIIVAGRGPETENLQQQTMVMGVNHKVNFVGYISDEDRNCLFKLADCAIFPSLYEPFGIVALEAMAIGCPVVVSDVGGFSEVVTHTETGLTTYPDNWESVAWGVCQALNHPELTEKYVAKAKQAVTELFNWTRIAELTKNVYQKTLDDGQIQNLT